MSLMTVRTPMQIRTPTRVLNSRGGPSFTSIAKPKAYGQGDIADAVLGVVTTGLQIAAQERAAYLAQKQAEAVARAQQAAQAAALQAQQQQQQQAALQQAAQLEAIRNAAAPAGSGFSLGVSSAPGATINVLGLQVPQWAFWGFLGLGGALVAKRALG